AIVGRPRF
uniref:Conorfamide Tx1.3 n=1 Tax=Conus textile TaxID=6494 RepID=COS_CONTE|nr:RecName: Full=Conorfamide Tx1.3; AltName: Full=AIVGRPRFamide; Short=AIVGRPRFa; AltName: Full=Cono-RFamide CNF-Tx1.3; Contains: RecName: Full=CNF-Tx1.2; AltName: Full=VGRPRFamide; Short=VGRPRFa; Contains: RecName: Full=CNF-Tx1.1; AltName: Full=RPRFamide; Short=RPRFa [Conus textile]